MGLAYTELMVEVCSHPPHSSTSWFKPSRNWSASIETGSWCVSLRRCFRASTDIAAPRVSSHSWVDCPCDLGLNRTFSCVIMENLLSFIANVSVHRGHHACSDSHCSLLKAFYPDDPLASGVGWYSPCYYHNLYIWRGVRSQGPGFYSLSVLREDPRYSQSLYLYRMDYYSQGCISHSFASCAGGSWLGS